MTKHPLGLEVLAFAILSSPLAWCQATQRVSLSASGAQSNQNSYRTSLSFDGRFVAFASSASNLVPGDTNGVRDVFVRDRATGTVELVSVSSSGVQGNGMSLEPSISADGRFVAFVSAASNLVPGDTNGVFDVFVRDREARTTVRASVDSLGREGNGPSSDVHTQDPMYDESGPSISADGRHVAFASYATNLVTGDANGALDVFVRDLDAGVTRRVSVDSGGVEGDGPSGNAGISISGDGRYVAFASSATNLAGHDTNGNYDVFLRDLRIGSTRLVSGDAAGNAWAGYSRVPSITPDGRWIAFSTSAEFSPPGSWSEIVVRDLLAGTVELVSVDPFGRPWDYATTPSISADGRYVAFSGFGLTWDDVGWYEIYVRDRETSTTEWTSPGVFGDMPRWSDCDFPSISGDGSAVGFESQSNQLVPEKTNIWTDAFVRVRAGGAGFTSVCEPGRNGVVGCPCSNPPSGLDRGCDNSSRSGGATLAASGGSFLSSDSLVFTTSGEPLSSASILFQGNAALPGGRTYGQGIRCVDGALRRLYTQVASDGGIQIPVFRRSDPEISRRSEELGDLIRAGESRWYAIVYRDPIVLGGCPSSSTFNATQAGVVTWSP